MSKSASRPKAKTKTSRSPTRRDRLMQDLALKRDQLEQSAHALRNRWGLAPDAVHERMFFRWSLALRDVVSYHLSMPGWDVDDDGNEHLQWRWDGNGLFVFCYCGSIAAAPLLDSPRQRMHVRVNMHLDPREPLEDELRRLAGDAAFYRRAGEMMERISYDLQAADILQNEE